jgi:site-specific recombinase XerD
LLSINEIKTKDPLLDAKIEEVCTGLQISYVNNLRSISIENNIVTIINYINSMKTELNLSINYRRDLIKLLTRFSEVNNKNFKDITRNDIISFLESFRKTETQDPPS